MIRRILRLLPALLLLQTVSTAQTVATFDGAAVDRKDYEQWLLVERGELMSQAFARGVTLVDHARGLGLALPPDEVRRTVEAEIDERISNAFGGDREAWVGELARARMTPQGYLERRSREVELDLWGKAIANVDRVVPEDKVERDFEKRYGPRGVKAKVRAIQLAIELVTPTGGWPAEERRAAVELAQAKERARLDELLAGVRTGTTRFSEVAELHSDHPSAPNGGMLEGYFESAGWPSTVVDAIVATPEGELTPTFAARGGVWVFQVAKRLETDFAQVRDALVQELVERGPEPDEVLAAVTPVLDGMQLETSEALRQGRVDDPAEVALTVNGRAISMGEYGGWLRRNYGEDLLPRYAERLALEAAADEHGFEPTDDDIDRRVEENRAITVELQFSGDFAAWEANLASNERDFDSWLREARRRARLELIAESIIKLDREITDAQLRSAWIERYGIDGKRVDARFIAKEVVLPEREEGEPDRSYQRRVNEAAEGALEALRELKLRVEDGVDFASLAEKHSDDRESAVLGGVPPGGFRIEAWSAKAIEVLQATPTGYLADPFLDGKIAVLFEVTGRLEVPYESVTDELRAALSAERVSVVDLAAFRNLLTRDLAIETQPAMFD